VSAGRRRPGRLALPDRPPQTAAALGFDRPTANSLDSVSARDFALEALSAASITATHLSRLAEEIVLWTTPMFGFIKLTDAFTTGSSIMPQKKNPDAAELIRAKVGRILGSLTTLTVVMKGLPLAYSKDMQEDKVPTFEAFDALELSLLAMAGMIADLTPNTDNMAKAAGAGFSTATDLADWLVRTLNMPFRDAHHVTGSAVKAAEGLGVDLADLTLEQFQAIEPRITQDVYAVLTPAASAASRMSYGGTLPPRSAPRSRVGRNCSHDPASPLTALVTLAALAATAAACGKQGTPWSVPRRCGTPRRRPPGKPSAARPRPRPTSRPARRRPGNPRPGLQQPHDPAAPLPGTKDPFGGPSAKGFPARLPTRHFR
jgi:hypothetical protein